MFLSVPLDRSLWRRFTNVLYILRVGAEANGIHRLFVDLENGVCHK